MHSSRSRRRRVRSSFSGVAERENGPSQKSDFFGGFVPLPLHMAFLRSLMLWSLVFIATSVWLGFHLSRRLLKALLPILESRLPGLSALVSPTLSLKLGSFKIGAIDLQIRGGRVCLSIQDVSIAADLVDSVLDPASPQPEDLRVVSLSQGMSWVVQLGSRFHPIWPFLTPWLRLAAHLQGALGFLSLHVHSVRVHVSLRPREGEEGRERAEPPCVVQCLALVSLEPQPWRGGEGAGFDVHIALHTTLPSSSPPTHHHHQHQQQQKEEGHATQGTLLSLLPCPSLPASACVVSTEGPLTLHLEVPWPPELEHTPAPAQSTRSAKYQGVRRLQMAQASQSHDRLVTHLRWAVAPDVLVCVPPTPEPDWNTNCEDGRELKQDGLGMSWRRGASSGPPLFVYVCRSPLQP